MSLAVFHQFSKKHEPRPLRNARRLLHVVRYDDDRVILFEFEHELFDPLGRDRVQRRTRFVHQHDVRRDGYEARDTKSLLLFQ